MARKKPNQQLIDQERARTIALFKSIGDGVIATNERGIITDINAAALRMLGFHKRELLGKWFPEALKAVDDDHHPVELIDRPATIAMITGKPITANMLYATKEHEVLPVAITVAPVMIDGHPQGVIELFRDISHEREVDRMKSEFISIASHQLRTPLSAIKTYAHMLEGGYGGKLQKQQVEFLNIILKSADRMNELINTLLDISRIEEGRLAIETRFVNLEELTETVVQELGPAAKSKKLAIDLSYESDDLNATTDPLLVKEVCANLLSNAIKYTQEGGNITICVSASGNQFAFTVDDDGYGIPAHEQSRVFSKFYRGENVVTKDTTGSGLGLYFVKKIAEELGGTITFKSKENNGSQFIFKLPRQ